LSHFISQIILRALFTLLFVAGWFGSAPGQEADRKPLSAISEPSSASKNGEPPTSKAKWNWNQRGRTIPAAQSAALRLRAYRQKLAMREARAAVSSTNAPSHGSNEEIALPATSSIWTPVGPAPLASDATGDGGQNYNWVSGRATSVFIDPADASANTVLLGGAYGGLWRSTNAGSLSTSPSAVVWQPLLDDQPTLAVGAIALQPGNSQIILVGTGETNNSSDSYYGLGILRSSNGGSTWTPITSAASGQSFLGIGFSKIAFSAANPNLVVAAAAGDNGLCLGEESAPVVDSGPCLGPTEDGISTVPGLYFSTDAGVIWNRATLTDGAIPASATSVIYNAANATFYASIRRHGLYSSTDGQNYTRLVTQPGAGLASANCPAAANATTCLIYRAEFAVVPGRNEIYAWIVDVQGDVQNSTPGPADEGIWQSTNGGASWTQIPDNGITNCGDDAFGPDSGCGVEQGWYNLALSAVPDPPSSSTGTDIYAGAINLYKCTLEPAASTACIQGDWINLTHAYGCDPLAAPAHVHPNQHGIAFSVVSASGLSPGYFAHDGGISRTLDGYSGLDTGSCSGTNQFDSLSETLGSMTEFISIAVHPTSANILLGGTENNGSPKTATATTGTTWQNALGGDGGFTAISPATPSLWFASNPYLTILECNSQTGTGSDCDDSTFVQIVGPNDLGGDEGAYITPYILDPQNAGEMLVGTCRVWSIGINGSSPQQLSNDFETFGTGVCSGEEVNLVTGLAAGGPTSGGNSSVVYAVTDGYGPLSGAPGGEVWVTTNAGTTLMQNVTQNINPQGYAISSVAMDSSDPTGNTAYVGIMGFSTPSYPTSHVWQTTNAGASWNDWSGSGLTALPDNPVNALLVDSGAAQIYAATDVGVFVSQTSAPSWTEVGPAPAPGASGYLPNAPVTALQLFNPDAGTRSLVASTYGRGVWNFALVASPAYTNAISNSPQTVFPTQTVMFSGKLTSQNGYASPVNLSCAGAAPPTCSLHPTPITPTATYSVVAGGPVGTYSFNAHAVGTDADDITRDAAVTLYVVDFNLTAPSPNSLTVGDSQTSPPSTFQVTALGNFAGTVTLACSTGLPAGAACVFSPSSTVSPSSASPVTVTLTVTAAASTPPGGPVIVTLSATAAGAPAPKMQTFLLTVLPPAPDFAIAVSATPTTTVTNQNVTWNGTLTALNGYAKSVTVSCNAGAPTTCSTPAPITPTAAGAPFAVTLGSAAAGTFNFTIQGTDGTLTHATPTETLTVTPPVANFTWTDTGSTSVSVLAGQSATYTFSAAPVGAGTFSSVVSFSCAGLPPLITGPPGATCGFTPGSIAAGSGTTTVTLTISTMGPNLGSQSQPASRRRLRHASTLSPNSPQSNSGTRVANYSYTLVLALLAGFFGIKTTSRAKPRLYCRIVNTCIAIALTTLVSCGGVGGSGGTPQVVTVTVNPGLATLFANEPNNSWPAGATQQQFAATVNGSTDQTVTWAVSGFVNGTVDPTGLYSAPTSVPSPATTAVTATSTAAPKPGSAFVTVASPTLVGASQITVTATAVGGAANSDTVTLTVQ